MDEAAPGTSVAGGAGVQPVDERLQPQPSPTGVDNEEEVTLMVDAAFLETCPSFEQTVFDFVRENELLNTNEINDETFKDLILNGELTMTKEKMEHLWVKVLKTVLDKHPNESPQYRMGLLLPEVKAIANYMESHHIMVDLHKELRDYPLTQDIILALYNVTNTFIIPTNSSGNGVANMCGFIFYVEKDRGKCGIELPPQHSAAPIGARLEAEHGVEWMARRNFSFLSNADWEGTDVKKKFKDRLNSVKDSCSAVVAIFMAHGREGFIAGADGTEIPISDLERIMKKVIKRKIPKVLFIQACRRERSSSSSLLSLISSIFSSPPEDSSSEDSSSEESSPPPKKSAPPPEESSPPPEESSPPSEEPAQESTELKNYIRVMAVSKGEGAQRNVFLCELMSQGNKGESFTKMLEMFKERMAAKSLPLPDVNVDMERELYLFDGQWPGGDKKTVNNDTYLRALFSEYEQRNGISNNSGRLRRSQCNIL